MKIFLDMDGVLVDFMRPVMAVHGIRYDMYPVEAGWDIMEAVGILAPEKKLTVSEFWAPCDRKFWAGLPKTNLCDTLIRTVEGYVGAENVALLTSAMWPEAAAGKVDWVMSNYPQYQSRLIMGTAKEFMAGPDRLLIDDRDKNVEDFRAAGGRAIKVPRPWNTLWRKRLPASYVLGQLAIMFGKL